MRYRVKSYTAVVENDLLTLTFIAPSGVELYPDPDSEIEVFILEAIRLIIDENSSVILCSSMQKRKYIQRAKCNVATRSIHLIFDIPENANIYSGDSFTIEMDWGESIEKVGKDIEDKIEQIEFPTDYAKELSMEEVLEKIGVLPNDNVPSLNWIKDNVIGDINANLSGINASVLSGISSISDKLTTVQNNIIGPGASLNLNSLKESIVGNGNNISLTSLNSALSNASTTINTINNKVITSSDLNAGLTGVNNNLNSVQSALSRQISDITFPTDYAKELTLTQGLLAGAKQTTVNNILGAVAQVNQQGVVTSSVFDIAINAKTAADNAKTAADTASSRALAASDAANTAKTASIAAQTAAEGVASAVVSNNKTVIGELLSTEHGLSKTYEKAVSASSNAATAVSYISDSTYGLSAIKTKLNSLPTTTPATPSDVTTAKEAIINAIPSVPTDYAKESNATNNRNTILSAINNISYDVQSSITEGLALALSRILKLTTSEYRDLTANGEISIPVSVGQTTDEEYPYGLYRDEESTEMVIRITKD